MSATPTLTVQESGLPALLHAVARYRHLLVPVSLLAMIIVLVAPLPPALLDILIAANISLAAVILLTTVYMARPLDFSVFPALLLATTLLRLVLNVATTRLILTADAATPQEAASVAGHVIQAFAHVVAGESVIVGAIVFIIIVVVQFVVITKGATRMSEVAARFTLDAMPGKQMAIDADLAAGLIDEATARQRREGIMREADFYGAMDGASKFVRGDAIAGVIIIIINIVGGFAIGWLHKGWSPAESVKVFTVLTIGDGLVTQLPAFIIAIAAGLIVARTGGEQTIGDEIPRQLASQPAALYLISGFLALLAFTGLPFVPLLSAAAMVGGLAWCVGYLARHDEERTRQEQSRLEVASTPAAPQAVEELLSVDAMEFEIGYGLVGLVDSARGGDLLERIAMIRRQIALDLGIVVPPIRIRDNMQLEASAYRVKLRGAVIGEGAVHPHLLLAIDGGLASERLDGLSGREPAFGLDATWIEPSMKHRAESLHYTVVDPISVLATHLTELVKGHAHELLSRQDVTHLLDQLRKQSPRLVDELVPAVVKVGELQKVLQNLLRERVPIRDLGAILETLGECIVHTRDAAVLTEYARHALRRTISAMHAEADERGRQRLYCVTTDPTLEEVISGYVEQGPGGMTLSIPPVLAKRIAGAVSKAAEPLAVGGHQLVILASPSVRAQVSQILDAQVPGATVMGYNEVVKGLEVESLGMVQLPVEAAASMAGAA